MTLQNGTVRVCKNVEKRPKVYANMGYISGFMAHVIKIDNAVHKMFKYPHKMARILEGMKR